MSNVTTTIPVIFEKITDYTGDPRFQPVKVWLMHLGENLNGSYFSKDAVEKAMPTLTNTPILGFIEDNKSGEEDFSDHRSEIIREDGKWKYKYQCSAYGVIPPDCNPQFEWRKCDDGEDREFLTVEGLMWTKWDEPLDILRRDESKSQSMELHPDFTGYFDKKDKLFHFSTFKFNGATVLGIDYQPGMHSASIETFSYEDAVKEALADVQTMMQQFKESQRNNSPEGGENMEVNKPQAEVTPNPETTPVVTAPVTVIPDPVSTESPIVYNFGLLNSQISSELDKALNPNPKKDEWGYSVYDYYYVDADTQNSLVVAYKSSDWELVGFSYTMNGDFPVIDFASEKRFKRSYVPMEGTEPAVFTLRSEAHAKYMADVAVKQAEKQAEVTFSEANDALKTQIETLTAENTELKEFKATAIVDSRKADEDDLFAQFAEQLTAEEIATVREKAAEFSIDDLKMQLFALVGMKTAKFSTTAKPNNVIRVPIDDPNRTPEAPRSNKSYAHLIEEVKASKNQ